MNSKTLSLIIAVVVIVGGLFAVRNLRNSVSTSSTETVDDTHLDSVDGPGADGRRGGEGTRISSSNSDRASNSDAGRGRGSSRSDSSLRRGEGAVNLKVTPATGPEKSEQASTSDDSDNTSISEEQKADNRSVADIANLFRNQKDPDERIDLADKLGMIDTPESIRTALELLKDETNPEVQEALIEAMQGLDSQDQLADEIFSRVTEVYSKTDSEDVKMAALDLMGDIATPGAADALRKVIASGSTDPNRVTVSAAENLIRIGQNNPNSVSPEEMETLRGGLKAAYNAPNTDGTFRQQVIMALAAEGKVNADFFASAAQTETDPQLREMLARLVQVYTAPPPATPPPGTVITPAPTPF